MVDTIFIEIVLKAKGIRDFIMEVECLRKKEVIDSALDFLKEYIIEGFEDKGLDISIIPDNLNDFMKWVEDISESAFTKYINSYVVDIICSFPKEGPLTGQWDVYDEELSRETEMLINEIIEKSETLYDFMKELKSAFFLDSVETVYDPQDMEDLAIEVADDVVRRLKKSRR